MRAVEPIRAGFADSGGVPIYWEEFGQGERTLLFVPPWQITHSRIFKMRSAWYGVILAAEHPERVERLVLLAPALSEGRPAGPDFHTPRDRYEGWQKYNAHYWREHDADFVEFFYEQLLSEPHSTTCMELTAAKWPFLYVPLRNHFEQNIHVAHRLARYGAGVRMDYAQADPDALAHAAAEALKRPVLARDVETDGARRAAARIARLL